MNWTVIVTDAFGALTTSEIEQNALLIRQYLMDHGWSQAAAAGVVGNAEAESQMNPGQAENGYGVPYNDTDVSFRGGLGLVQWTPNDPADDHPLIKYAMDHNSVWKNPTLQLKYIMDPSHWMGGPLYPLAVYGLLQDSNKAGYDYAQYYVVPPGGDATYRYRASLADNWMTFFNDHPYLPLPLLLIVCVIKKLRQRRLNK